MSDRRLVAALLLLDLSILTLVLGHFVQLHDTSGFGSDEWSLPLGALAAALGIASLVVATPDRRARRALGIALLAGVAVLVLLQLTVDGFRFVWGSGEFELGALEVLLVCVGLVLVATGAPRPSAAVLPAVAEQPSVPWTVRALLYLAATVALVFVAGMVGATYGDGQCTGDGDDCLAAPVWSLVFALGGVVAMVVLVATCELTLRAGRRRTDP